MALTYAVGNDGAVVLPSGVGFNVKVWAANVSFVSSDLTGFAHTGKVRRLGVIDITGSLAGTPWHGTSGTPFGTLASNLPASQLGGTMVLSVNGGTSTTASSNACFEFGAVFSSIAFNSDKNGDATLTLNYEMNDSNGPSIIWATS